tara:strand:- start:10778 stop:11632 length:855 start_codon:yes stop_codon:yes gene_type:complete
MSEISLDIGRSGCEIQLVKEKNPFIRKISSSLNYNVRLECQCKKQNNFRLKSFKTPKIYNKGINSENLYFFDMEYIHGYNVCDFFSFASPSDISKLYSKLENFLNSNILNSKKSDINSLVENKVNDLNYILKSNSYYSKNFKNKIFDYLFTRIPQTEIPIGYCHGDLTFSNILFKNIEELYLIDFLDSFIDSPIIDLVKIRQDTKFHWTLLITKNLPQYKVLRVKQIFDYIDFNLMQFIEKNKNVKLWYYYLEILNLVRIMPYVDDINEIEFLKINLNKLIYKV